MAVHLSCRPQPSTPTPISPLRRSARLRPSTPSPAPHKLNPANPRKRHRESDLRLPRSPQQLPTPTQTPRSLRALKRQKLDPPTPVPLTNQLPLPHTKKRKPRDRAHDAEVEDVDLPVGLPTKKPRQEETCAAVGCDPVRPALLSYHIGLTHLCSSQSPKPYHSNGSVSLVPRLPRRP
jgi:hypothetical protein